MKPYIVYREIVDDGVLGYFILQRDFPHFIGQLVGYPIAGALANAPVAGYNFWVTFKGTLRGNMIPNYKDIQEEIKQIYDSMALWYLDNIILKNEKLYQKFKIKNNADLPR